MSAPPRVRFFLLTVLLCWGVAVLLSARHKSAAGDELPHLGAGLAILRYGDFRMNPEHPPLMKVLSMIPVYLFYRPDMWTETEDVELAPWFDSNQSLYGYALLFLSGRDPLRLLLIGRIVPVIVAMLGGLLAYLWGRELSRKWLGGALSAALLLFYPEYAGHARFITFDVPTLVACGWISWAVWRWWRKPALASAAHMVLACALGSLVKLPVWLFAAFSLGLLLVLAAGLKNRRRLRLALLLCLAVFAGCYLSAWAGSLFRFSLIGEGHRYSQLSPHVPPIEASQGLLAEVVSFCWEHRLLPEATLATITHVGSFSAREMFLMGEVSLEGWYHYFLVTILIKTPLPMLAGGIWLVVRGAKTWRRRGRSARAGYAAQRALLFAGPFALLFALMVWSRVNIGHRHILFLYFPWCCLLGAEAANWIGGRSWRPLLGLLLVVSQIASFVLTTPHWATYSNLAFGGPLRASRWVSDSNFDWGQDVPLLAEWLAYSGYSRVNYAVFGPNRPEAFGIEEYRWILPGYPYALEMPEARPPDPAVPTAVSLRNLPDLRFYYRRDYNRPPDVLLNSIVVFLPE